MLLFLFIQQIICWKTQTVTQIYSNCQAFESSQQSECNSNDIKVFKIESHFLICYIKNIEQQQFQSILFTDEVDNQYYVILIQNTFNIITLPYNCNNNIKKVTFQQSIHNYSMTNNNESIYIFGGFEGITLTNNLYQISFQELISNYNLNQYILPNNYIVNISVSLQLWDESHEDYTFINDIPFICKLKQLNYEIKINSDLDNNNCDSLKIPKCLQNSILIYREECNTLQLFYGIDNSGNIRNESWIYYINEQVWEFNSQNNLFKLNLNPVGSYFKEIDVIGFYGGNKYFFYYEGNWYDNYEIVNFGQQFTQLIGYKNMTYLLNETSILYSGNIDQHVTYQQYGIYLCEDNYHGYDCQVSSTQCPGSICFNDLLYERICVDCSGHGICMNGKCKCDDGYDGNDCNNYVKCLNDCSSFGQCINYYPLSQCRCNQQQKRGGEDCSVLFCLNDCSNNGICQKGVCQCNTGSKGDDCSILDLKFIDE